MLGVDHPNLATTLHELGSCLFAAEQTAKEGEEFCRGALSIREETLGANHPDVAATLHCLGEHALRAGQEEKSKELL